MSSAPVNRRQILAFLALLGVSESSLRAQDATKIDPQSYRVAFENDKVRVLEFRSRPGSGICGVGRHSHPPHLTIVLTDAKARVTLEDGKQLIAQTRRAICFGRPLKRILLKTTGRQTYIPILSRSKTRCTKQRERTRRQATEPSSLPDIGSFRLCSSSLLAFRTHQDRGYPGAARVS